MLRRSLICAGALFLGGCATASPEVVRTAPAGGDSFECAVSALAERGYELRELDHEVLEAEVRRVYVPVGTVREVIRVSLSGAANTPELQLNVSATEYGPAEHGLPINRQSVYEVRPSEEVVEDGIQVLQLCGRDLTYGS